MNKLLSALSELFFLGVALLIAFAVWWIMVNGSLAVGEWLRTL